MEYGRQIFAKLEEQHQKEAAEKARMRAERQNRDQEAKIRQAKQEVLRQDETDRAFKVRQRINETVTQILNETMQSMPEIVKSGRRRIRTYNEGMVCFYKLEWGEKLEPSPEEAKILKQRYKMGGLAGLIQTARAPDSILECDKSSISLEIKPKSYFDRTIAVGGIVADDFLESPDLIIPSLVDQLAKPHYSHIVRAKGSDYLCTKSYYADSKPEYYGGESCSS